MKNYARLVLFLLALCLAACTTPRKLSYLLDMKYGQQYQALPAPELVVQVDDCLGIVVASEMPQLAAPFNQLPSLSESENVSGNRQPYYVDRNGNIDFPILGTLHVAGKTLTEVKELLVSKIKQTGYIKDPVVQVRLENFSITVVGATGNQVMSVKDNSINLLQVVASSGGTNVYSNIKDVMVVRTEDGKHTAYSVNLQSTDLFTSPVFYLKQKDVVYLKPQGNRMSSDMQLVMSFVSAGLSLGTIISTILLFFK